MNKNSIMIDENTALFDGCRIVAYNSNNNSRVEHKSIREASRCIGISATSISNCLKGKYDCIKGYYFQEVGAK